MATVSADLALEARADAALGANQASGAKAPAKPANRTASGLLLFAKSAFEMFNPNTPGKAEMRNCDEKRAAMLKDPAEAS